MAKGNIDPAMRPAVVLQKSQMGGGGGMDGYERAMKQQQLKQARDQEGRASIERGLKDLNKTLEDLQGWEDQHGFEEIMKDHQKVIDVYLDLSKMGLNLVAPKNESEIYAYKAIQKAHANIIKKINAWEQNKTTIEAINKVREAEAGKSPSEQKIDWEKTDQNINAQYQDGIMNRNMNISSLVVYKPEIGNLDQLMKDKAPYITEVLTDPETGIPDSRLIKLQEQDMMEVFEELDDSHLEALRQTKARAEKVNPNLESVPLKDYFVARYSPAARDKLTRALKQMDEEEKTKTVSFLGTEVKMKPGQYQDVTEKIGDKVFNERYTFSFPTRKLFDVPVGNAEQHTGTGWKPIGTASRIDAELRFYDPQTDRVIFKTGESSKTPWVENNTIISVPASDLPDVDDLPIVVDGKEKKLGDVRPKEKEETVRTIGGLDFRTEGTYIPGKMKP
jgi:hypothetical protein